MPEVATRRPHPAQVYLFSEGKTQKDFARFHGCTPHWVTAVLSGRARPPERFKKDLADFLGLPPSLLFPEDS